MLDARFLHLWAYFCQKLRTLQRGLSAIADLLVFVIITASFQAADICRTVRLRSPDMKESVGVKPP